MRRPPSTAGNGRSRRHPPRAAVGAGTQGRPLPQPQTRDPLPACCRGNGLPRRPPCLRVAPFPNSRVASRGLSESEGDPSSPGTCPPRPEPAAEGARAQRSGRRGALGPGGRRLQGPRRDPWPCPRVWPELACAPTPRAFRGPHEGRGRRKRLCPGGDRLWCPRRRPRLQRLLAQAAPRLPAGEGKGCRPSHLTSALR